jgi:voltage-dependent potassium channel beta subunit
MEYRRLGRSGLKVSSLSFGSWVTFSNQVDVSRAEELMQYAYEQGINFFDNAEVYAAGKSEEVMGEALKKLNWRRDTYCVSSKVFWGGRTPTQRGLSKKHIRDACHAALRRLKLEYLDLFFCHRPDRDTPIEETVRGMNHLIEQGKILYWGTSEWSAPEIAEAQGIAKSLGLEGPTMEQPEYNMFERRKVEGDFQSLYRGQGLGTTVWSPLASGLLTGKYLEGIPEDSRANVSGYEWLRDRFESEEGQKKLAKVKEIKKISDDLGVSLAKFSIAWCLACPYVSTVILGASKLEQLKENCAALEVLPLMTEDVIQKVDKILQNRPEPLESFA